MKMKSLPANKIDFAANDVDRFLSHQFRRQKYSWSSLLHFLHTETKFCKLNWPMKQAFLNGPVHGSLVYSHDKFMGKPNYNWPKIKTFSVLQSMSVRNCKF